MSETENPLLEPYNLAGLDLKNRVVMAPMTRSRAGDGNVPTDLNAKYYRQRASAGLIISEGTQISEQGIGYPWTPGIHTKAQVEGWKKVTQAVHDEGGKIFAQLWHVGRIGHPSLRDGALPVAPSAVKPEGQAFTPEGMKEYVTPRALKTDEIPPIIDDFAAAAQHALNAGFDGVEIHGANGYLIDQFIQDSTNQRDDKYGGSVENRARFALEVVKAVTEVASASKTGIRLSPSGEYNDMRDENPKHTFTYLISKLNAYDLAYLHLVEPLTDVSERANYLQNVTAFYRDVYKGTIITCGNLNREDGIERLENETAELVAYARLFLANPDLPARFAAEADLNEPNPDTFYGGDQEGYTDYLFMDDEN